MPVVYQDVILCLAHSSLSITTVYFTEPTPVTFAPVCDISKMSFLCCLVSVRRKSLLGTHLLTPVGDCPEINIKSKAATGEVLLSAQLPLTCDKSFRKNDLHTDRCLHLTTSLLPPHKQHQNNNSVLTSHFWKQNKNFLSCTWMLPEPVYLTRSARHCGHGL